MPHRRLLGPLAIAVLSTAIGGCSFAFVDGPPANHRTSRFFGCTSSNALPALDTVAATIGLLDAISWGTGSASDSSSTRSRTESAVAFGAGAAVLAASAAYGYKKTSECREAEADLLRRTPITPVFTGAPGPYASPRLQGPYDPWVAPPPAAPAAPPAPAAPAPVTAPGSSPWDGAMQRK